MPNKNKPEVLRKRLGNSLFDEVNDLKKLILALTKEIEELKNKPPLICCPGHYQQITYPPLTAPNTTPNTTPILPYYPNFPLTPPFVCTTPTPPNGTYTGVGGGVSCSCSSQTTTNHTFTDSRGPGAACQGKLK